MRFAAAFRRKSFIACALATRPAAIRLERAA